MESSSVVKSYEKKSKDENWRDEERKKFTVLFRKISAKYLAPSAPIFVEDKINSVSVYVKNNDEHKEDE